MEPVRQVEGRAYPWGAKNIDTDIIIPAHWLKTTTREGLGKGAFETVRAQPDNIVDDPRYAGAPVLIAGDNFGCGSSREHAPWALEDYGFKTVIAKSFADIFRGNAPKTGLLPVELADEEVDFVAQQDQAEVDLESQEVRAGGRTFTFEFPAESKRRLLNGLDDIGMTLDSEDRISAYESERERKGPDTLQFA